MNSDNHKKLLNLVFKLLIFVLLAIFVVWQGVFFLLLLLLLFLVIFTSYHLDWGWYVLVFLSPMINWVISFEDYWYFFQDYPTLLNINAPAVDFWLVLLLSSFIFCLVRKWFQGKKVDIKFPVFGLYLLFLLSAILSIFSIPSGAESIGLKYILRFILLIYFGFIFLGSNIVKDKKILDRSLITLASVGVLASVMGLVSFFLGVGVEVYGIPRSTPFAIGGWIPFGFQHIFLAETITTALPIMLLFWYRAHDKKIKNIWAGLALFSLFIGLMTLSRAAWVTIAFSSILFIFLIRDKINLSEIIKKYVWLSAVVLPIFFYLLYFMSSSWLVTSSTNPRWYLTEIALYLFSTHPIVGNGIGTFLHELNDIEFFWYEIGDLTDAHGILQKIISEQGLLGLITFGLFIGYIVYKLYKKFKINSLSNETGVYSLLGIFLITVPLTFQLFSTQYYTAKMWVPIGLAVVIYLFLYRLKKEKP